MNIARRTGIVFFLLFCNKYMFAHEIVRGDKCWGEKAYFFIRQGDIDLKRKPNDSGYADAGAVKYKTSDGVMLGGLLLKGKNFDLNNRKLLLVALGNAMRADDYYKNFLPFSELGIDIYIYDYRGFGRSDGQAALSDQVLDFKELYSFLHKNYSKSYVYGISHGGVIAINALHDISITYKAIILDSIPSIVPSTICYTSIYDPVNFINTFKAPVLIISGAKDTEIPRHQQEEFINEAVNVQKKACLAYGTNTGHPFSVADNLDDNFRIQEIAKFLITDGKQCK